jgi:hypothetical protein
MGQGELTLRAGFPTLTIIILILISIISVTLNTGTSLDVSGENTSRPRSNGFDAWCPMEVVSEPVYGQNFNIETSDCPQIAAENGMVYVVWDDENETDGAGDDTDIF